MIRDQAIQSLVRFDQPFPLLEATLGSWPWDWDGVPLATLDATAVVAVLRRHSAGELSDAQVEQWAFLIEGREDIDYTQEVAEALFLLATPEINGPTDVVAQELLSRLG